MKRWQHQYLLATSGVARRSAALSISQICLREFKVKEDHTSCLVKI